MTSIMTVFRLLPGGNKGRTAYSGTNRIASSISSVLKWETVAVEHRYVMKICDPDR
jgi:hypothetical protein